MYQRDLGLTGVEIRALVNMYRRNKIPIGSSSNGYFYARNEDDIQNTIQHMKERERSIRACRIGLEKSFIKQNNLFD